MKQTVLTFALGCPCDSHPLSFRNPESEDVMVCKWCGATYTVGSLVKLIPPDIPDVDEEGSA